MAEGKDGGDQTEVVVIAILIAVIAGGWFFWQYARSVIIYPTFALDWVSVQIIDSVRGLGERGTSVLDFIESVFDGRQSAGQDVSWREYSFVRQSVGSITRWVYAPCILFMAVWVYLKMPGGRYARRFNLAGTTNGQESLADYQAKHWKVATSSLKFEPEGLGAKVAQQKTPMEWMRDNSVPLKDGVLDQSVAIGAFTHQLGARWRGFDEAPLTTKVVLILHILHLIRHPDALCERQKLSVACALQNSGEAEMKRLINTYSSDERIRKLLKKIGKYHAYEHTVVMGFARRAKTKVSLIPSSEFLWTKWYDRTLFYVLNNDGRPTYHIEAAGIVSHFKAETAVGRAIVDAKVDGAVDGLEFVMAREGIVDLEAYFNTPKDPDDLLL
ncbi:secretion/conjugation apparatus DotM-related subunit [Flexibacterium corallicola]|uniref:secretion/conjugation apparatus DotM-related subunit n=1 Tax=Flexibacterium corallicola TaxID=3037259 RepID=UPI00286F5E84|nr:hypothetical protein [Pseudovibrio sp. M1P-2-3]